MKPWLLVIYLFSESLFSGTLSLFSITRTPQGYIYYNVALALVIALLSFYEMLKKIKNKEDKISYKKFQVVFLLMIIFAGILFSYMMFYPSEVMPQIVKYFISFTIPAVALALIVSEKNVAEAFTKLKYINVYITICFAMSLAQSSNIDYGILNDVGGSSKILVGYTMSALFGYNLLNFINSKNWFYKAFHLLLMGFNILIIVFSGSRGALVSVIVIFVFATIKYLLNRRKFLILILTVLMTMGLFNVIKKNDDFNFAIERMLSALNIQNDQSSQTRFVLFDKVVDSFEKSPIFGSGIGSFSIETGRYYYPHNIGVEILNDFGLIGVILSLVILAFVIRESRKILKGDAKYHLLVFLFINVFVQLMFSSSYLVNSQFWLLGVLIWVLNKKNIIKEPILNKTV